MYRRNKSWIHKPFTIEEFPYGEKDEDYFTAIFRRDRKDYFYRPKNDADFFTERDRIRMVAYALQEVNTNDTKMITLEEAGEVGINRLLRGKEPVLEEFYPLHDDTHSAGEKCVIEVTNEESARRYLHKNWAMYHNMFKMQPLHEIKEGDKFDQ